MTAPLIDRMAEALRECAGDLGSQNVERYAGTLHDASQKNDYDLDMAPVRQAKAILAEYDRREQGGPITQEMIREAQAHLPLRIKERPAQWEWLANFLSNALANPDTPCPCCNVTPAGDICDHLREPLTENLTAALKGHGTTSAAGDQPTSLDSPP